jgi:hypothetical protein
MPEGLPAWFDESGYVILVVCSLVMAHEAYRALRYRRERYDGWFTVVGLLWGIGLGCKVAGIGPDVLRFWLADMGFPLLVSWALWEVVRGRRYKEVRRTATTEAQALAMFRRKIVSRQHTLIVAVLLSYCYELVSGLMAKMVNDAQPPGSNKVPVGEFDWFDMAAYTLGGLIGWWILVRWIKFVDGFTAAAADQDRQKVKWRDPVATQVRHDAELERRKRKRLRKPNTRRGR